MNLIDRLFLSCARIFPRSYRSKVHECLKLGGYSGRGDSWIGCALVIGVVLSGVLFMLPMLFEHPSVSVHKNQVTGFLADIDLVENTPDFAVFSVNKSMLLLGFMLTILLQLLVFLVAYFRSENRRRAVERVLPDALELMAANIHAGMTPAMALHKAARDEFGPLKEEIDGVLSREAAGESFEDALLGMASRVRSPTLERVVKLMVNAIRSGGHFGPLLEEISKDLMQTTSLRAEMMTSTKSYTMFITFTIIFGTPVLFVIAIQFLKMLGAMQAITGAAVAQDAFGSAIVSAGVGISPVLFTYFAIGTILITGVLASFLLGAIKEGQAVYGLRYAPLLCGASCIMFVITKVLVGKFFAVG